MTDRSFPNQVAHHTRNSMEPATFQDDRSPDRVSISSENSSVDDRLPKDTILGCRVSFLNVIFMGVGFMLNVGAANTAGAAQTVVLNSVKDDYFQGYPTLGYILWTICCVAQALSFLLAPTVVAITGPKLGMVLAALGISFYIGCFIRPLMAPLYMGAALFGFGCGIIWTVQGYFITINSTSKRVLRNTGIFLALYQSSMVTGNLFYFLMVHGSHTILPETRVIVFSTLFGCSLLGVLVLSCVVHPWTGKVPLAPEQILGVPSAVPCPLNGEEPDQIVPEYRKPKAAFKATVKFFRARDMLLLLPFFVYIGVEQVLWGNVYPTALGYTLRFDRLRESLVGLSGVFGGVGEIVGGIVLGLSGKWMHFHGKDGAVIGGLVVHIGACYIAYLNTPAHSSLEMTGDGAFVGPNPVIALCASFLFGFGDAVWNGQLMAYLGETYRHECVSVFAVYQFWCAFTAAGAFAYAVVLELPYQLLIVVICGLPAAAGFCTVEWGNLLKYGRLRPS